MRGIYRNLAKSENLLPDLRLLFQLRHLSFPDDSGYRRFALGVFKREVNARGVMASAGDLAAHPNVSKRGSIRQRLGDVVGEGIDADGVDLRVEAIVWWGMGLIWHFNNGRSESTNRRRFCYGQP
jgi:hypothetical protein